MINNGNGFKLLDTFCKAGGAGAGYAQAGFEVVGVDIEPQPHYPYEFHQADALQFIADHGHEFDAIHASPPCQDYTWASIQHKKNGKKYPDLLAPTRDALIKTGLPYVIENVVGAPLLNPIVLNGLFFGLRVRRTRLFEMNFEIPFFLIPKEGRSFFRKGRKNKDGDIVVPVGHFSNIAYVRKVMGIDWMNQEELANAVPPAYTEFIGNILLQHLQEKRAK